MNNQIEQETLSNGAMSFMRKPIKPNDINTIWKPISNYQINGNDDVYGSKENGMTELTNDPHYGDSQPHATKKSIKWSNSLQHRFLAAIHHIGLDKATPKKIIDFMDVKYLTRAHVASHLQKYRNFLKRVQEEGMDITSRQMLERWTMNSSFTLPGYANSLHSYNYTKSLSNNNLSSSQLDYGLGQSSLMMLNNNASLHDIHYMMNHIPTYDSSLMPMKRSLESSNGILPLNEERRSISPTSQVSQVPSFGIFGTTSDVLGMNSNFSTGYMGNNYGGIMMKGNGDSVGHCGRVNSFIGENLGAMNWNFNNQGSSTSRVSSTYPSFLDNEYQSQYNLTVQTNGVVPVLENLNTGYDQHGINEGFYNTINSQFDQNQQHQGIMNGENLGVSTDELLERNTILAPFPLEDICNSSFDNENSNEATLNSIAGNSEMNFPICDMNVTNQEHDTADLREPPFSADQDWNDDDFMKYLVDYDMI